MNDKRAIKEAGPNPMPVQQAVDATICSVDSSTDGQGSMVNTRPKPDGKIKPYVDFTDFNKNYEEYLKRNNKSQMNQTPFNSNNEANPKGDSGPVLDRSNSNSSQSTEEWVVLN